MRGQREKQQSMFVAFSVEDGVPEDHPLRAIKRRRGRILAAMSRDFDACYGSTGRVGIPPESLLKALLPRALFGIPSERRLCEVCEFNIPYRWFLDWPLERPMWTPEAFSMNRERFESRALVARFFERIVAEGIEAGLVGDDRFSVDGTLIRSLVGHKSVKPIDEDRDDDDLNGWSNFKGKKRSNRRRRSVVDPEACLASRGGEGRLCHSLHALADAGYGAGEFLCAVEERGITPHAAMAGGNDVEGDASGAAPADAPESRARRRRSTMNAPRER